MRISDEQLHALVSLYPRDPALLNELTERVKWKAIRAMPNPRGRCDHAKVVYADQQGAYSSGYIVHEKGHGLCNGGMGLNVRWFENPRRERLRGLLRTLRGAA